MTHEVQTDKKVTIYHGKSNLFFYTANAVWSIFWFSIGCVIFIGGPALFLAGIIGMINNDGKVNHVVANIGTLLIPILIIGKIIYTIWLRKVQFYIVTNRKIQIVGGILHHYSHTINLSEIRSVSYTRTLLQQICGCGDVVVSTAATARGIIVLKNINCPKDIYQKINSNR